MELGRGALSTVRLSHGLAVKITRKPILLLLKQAYIAAREKEALEAAVLGGSSLYLAQIRHAAQTASQLFSQPDRRWRCSSLACRIVQRLFGL